jgi:hypothetical protein
MKNHKKLLAEVFMNYESDTFSASGSTLQQVEAEKMAEYYFDLFVAHLADRQEAHLIADGGALSETLARVRGQLND